MKITLWQTFAEPLFVNDNVLDIKTKECKDEVIEALLDRA
jgi:hypothetical protein